MRCCMFIEELEGLFLDLPQFCFLWGINNFQILIIENLFEECNLDFLLQLDKPSLAMT